MDEGDFPLVTFLQINTINDDTEITGLGMDRVSSVYYLYTT